MLVLLRRVLEMIKHRNNKGAADLSARAFGGASRHRRSCCRQYPCLAMSAFLMVLGVLARVDAVVVAYNSCFHVRASVATLLIITLSFLSLRCPVAARQIGLHSRNSAFPAPTASSPKARTPENVAC